jgi:hypothetical protein
VSGSGRSEIKMPLICEDFTEESDGARQHPKVLDKMRLGPNETAIALITKKYSPCPVHYVEELNTYVQCNKEEAESCLLCRIGRKKVTKLLLPAYSFQSGQIEVLAVTRSSRPYDLKPLLDNILTSEKRVVVFISLDQYRYQVSTSKLKKRDRRIISSIVKEFLTSWEDGEIDLTTVFQTIDNESLAALPGVKRMMELKGIRIDIDDEIDQDD